MLGGVPGKGLLQLILGRRSEFIPKHHRMRLTQGCHVEVDPFARMSNGQTSPTGSISIDQNLSTTWFSTPCPGFRFFLTSSSLTVLRRQNSQLVRLEVVPTGTMAQMDEISGLLRSAFSPVFVVAVAAFLEIIYHLLPPAG